MDFIDYYRDLYGVESICKVLPIAPSTFHRHKALEKNDKLRCKRHHTDEKLKGEIQRVWQENRRVYGAPKVWKQLKREGIKAARCTVERLMRTLGIQGVRRGRRCITTIPDENAARPLDHVIQILQRPVLINCGWLISPTVPHGQVLFMSRLLSMFSHEKSWVGVR